MVDVRIVSACWQILTVRIPAEGLDLMNYYPRRKLTGWAAGRGLFSVSVPTKCVITEIRGASASIPATLTISP